MNKKSKRITLGLVSALCLLLVVALGFGVTGAWYRARRQATGTVKLDKGIILTITDLNQDADPDVVIAADVVGNLWVLNSTKDALVGLGGNGADNVLAMRTQPGETATKYVAVPTIAAASGSTSFYAKAKIVTTVYKYASEQDRSEANMTVVDVTTLYTDPEHTDAATLADVLANTLQLDATVWDSTGMGNGYSLYIGTSGTAGTPKAFGFGTGETNTAVALLTDDNQDGLTGEGALAQKGYDTISFADWTEPTEEQLTAGNGAGYVEFGGPVLYTDAGARVEIGKITFQIVIDVIQSENLTSEALTAWKAAA